MQEVESNGEECREHQNVAGSCGSVWRNKGVPAHSISADFHWAQGAGLTERLQFESFIGDGAWQDVLFKNPESRNLNSFLWDPSRARICHENFPIFLRVTSVGFVNSGVLVLDGKFTLIRQHPP